jgi:hypothetical protein
VSSLRRWALGVAAIAGLAAIACDDREDVRKVEIGPAALYRGEWNGDAALLEGNFVREGGCLFVDAAGGRPRFLVAFAADGTRWAGDALVIDGVRFVPGEPASFGGSEASAETVNWLVPPDDSCAYDGIWLAGRP